MTSETMVQLEKLRIRSCITETECEAWLITGGSVCADADAEGDRFVFCYTAAQSIPRMTSTGRLFSALSHLYHESDFVALSYLKTGKKSLWG